MSSAESRSFRGAFYWRTFVKYTRAKANRKKSFSARFVMHGCAHSIRWNTICDDIQKDHKNVLNAIKYRRTEQPYFVTLRTFTPTLISSVRYAISHSKLLLLSRYIQCIKYALIMTAQVLTKFSVEYLGSCCNSHGWEIVQMLILPRVVHLAPKYVQSPEKSTPRRMERWQK